METKWIKNSKWHGGSLVTMVLILFFFESCQKDIYAPSDQGMANIEKKLGDDDIVNFVEGSSVIKPVLNRFNSKIGIMELTFDGKYIMIYFLPHKEWMLKRGYANMDKYENFPFLFGEKIPDINRFRYKYVMTVNEIGVDKTSASEQDVPFEPIIPYGRPKPIMTLIAKDVPKSGILAIHLQCRKIGEIQVYKDEGLGWMDGERFHSRERAMYVFYNLRI